MFKTARKNTLLQREEQEPDFIETTEKYDEIGIGHGYHT